MLTVLFCHFREERRRLAGTASSLDMPINNRIDAHLNSCIHNCEQSGLVPIGIGQIAATNWTATVGNTYGAPNDTDVPIGSQILDNVAIPERRRPIGPKHRHPVKLHSVTILVQNSVSLLLQRTMTRDWRVTGRAW